MATKEASFIENVQTIANATKLSTGDIVEDTERARDEAVTAKEGAELAETNAKTSELLAKDWAEKGHNNPVDDTSGSEKYSSYHWATEAMISVGDPLINDLAISAVKTWSSQKTTDELALKSDATHNHSTVYEPIIVKNNGFNKNFGTTFDTVSEGNHGHADLEPAIGTKNTGFNKNFGSDVDTVSEGNHGHDDLEPKRATNGTAYNKDFVVDPNAPLPTEVPKGNHNHQAGGIVYDPSTNTVVNSTTVQGAITQLDANVATITIAEKCNLGAGMTNLLHTVPITTVAVGSKIITAMTVSTGLKNAIYSGGDLTINYPTAPEKLIAGWISVTVTIDMLANKEYGMAIWADDVLIDEAFRVQLGSTDKDTTGTFPMSLDGYISGITNGTRLSVGLYNMTDNTDISILSHTISFAGEPEGSLVASGSTVDHSNLTGTGAAGGVHTISDIQGLQTEIDTKAELAGSSAQLFEVASGTAGNEAITFTQLGTKTDKSVPSASGNIATLDGTGNLSDGGKTIAELALLEGNASQTFLVSDATLATEAVSKGQMDSLATNYAPLVHTHVISDVTGLQTELDGKADTVHTHVISDTTGLQDALNDKYSKVSTPVTNNMVGFDVSGGLNDSGIAPTDVTDNAAAIVAINTATELTGEAV